MENPVLQVLIRVPTPISRFAGRDCRGCGCWLSMTKLTPATWSAAFSARTRRGSRRQVGRGSIGSDRRINPDVLVSDIAMPGEDGYELIRKLRLRDSLHGGRLPAIALTALARTEDRDRALKAGYHAHLPKPVQPIELSTAVAELARH